MRGSKCILAAVAGLAVALLVASGAKADTVDITAKVGTPNPTDTVSIYFHGKLGPNTYTISGECYAGVINWSNAVDVGNLDTPAPGLLGQMPISFQSGVLNTYCIDIAEDISVGETLNPAFTGLTNDLAGTPIVDQTKYPGFNGMTSTTAGLIENLYANDYSLNPSNDEAAAFQIAIWDIIYGTAGYSVADQTNNQFYVSGANSNVVTLANQYVAGAATNTKPFLDVLALTDPGVQDQLVVGVGPAFFPSTPLPASAISGIVLLGGLAVAKRMRRDR
ncbi:MAG TPA: hypothetical protein VGG19_20470 [Tepidisphaeraceae bacterium]|jgi:hypothetical protein